MAGPCLAASPSPRPGRSVPAQGRPQYEREYQPHPRDSDGLAPGWCSEHRMAGLPRLPRLPRERAAKVRLPRVQRDRHDVPRLLVETSEGLEAFLDFLMKPEQASTLTRGT